LIESRGGVFEVVTDGVTVFSKKNLGRFPEDNEVTELINGGSTFKV
jgi:selT/selW/selH-like putative selenoprotein